MCQLFILTVLLEVYEGDNSSGVRVVPQAVCCGFYFPELFAWSQQDKQGVDGCVLSLNMLFAFFPGLLT